MEITGQERQPTSISALRAWTSYVGHKYTQLRDLDLCTAYFCRGGVQGIDINLSCRYTWKFETLQRLLFQRASSLSTGV